VARDLLGCRLRSTVGKVATAGIIVETEAYVGSHDPASHAVATVGRTRRNASMFGPPGRAYVYRSYGIHWCLNVVTEPEGFPAAVLIRGLAPLEGTGEMARRRGGRRHPLCAGPGRLAQALGVTGELDGHPLWKAPLTIGPCEETPDVPVGVSGRIGIRHATDWPLRFFLRGSPGVSGNPR
jgi:DNA-3-methyladenine glycosylase